MCLCLCVCVCAASGKSVRIFKSSEARNGTFTSPNYPNRYPQGVTVHYVFQGSDNDRVQITFLDIDLYYTRVEANFAVELVSHPGLHNCNVLHTY